MFSSCQEAVAYALSRRRGPQAARPSLGRTPSGYRSEWDANRVRACMTRAGIEQGSLEEREIDAWARAKGPKPIHLERALRKELDAHGLLKRADPVLRVRREDLPEVMWTDPDTGESKGSFAVTREDVDDE